MGAQTIIKGVLLATSFALSASRKIEGPRLDELKFSGGDYGAPLPLIWGKRRMQCPIFWAEDLKEVKQQRKTKGGKYNDYTYFGTFAVALAGHEIAGVTRVWFDTHLVYDVTGVGPITPFNWTLGGRELTEKGRNNPGLVEGISNKTRGRVALYTGTETQEADPRIEATVEAEFGVGSCPAYRGTAYMVFKELPLEKFGNRIPQVSVEIVSGTTASYPYETVTGPAGLYTRRAGFSADFSRLVIWGDKFEVWDIASRSLLSIGDWPTEPYPTAGNKPGVFSDGRTWFCSAGQNIILQYDADLLGPPVTAFTFGDMQQNLRVMIDANDNEHWGTIASSIGPEVYFNGNLIDLSVLTGGAFNVRSYFADAHGDIWVCGDRNDTTAVFYRLVDCGARGGDSLIIATGLSDISGGGGATDSGIVEGAHYLSATSDHFILMWGGVATYAIDIETGAVLFTAAATGRQSYLNFMPGSPTLWDSEREIDLATLTTIRTINPNSWTAGFTGLGPLYDPVNHALLFSGSISASQTWFYLDRIASPGVALSTIAGDVADLAGVVDYDFSALDQVVPGWSATLGQASNMLEPLLDIYDSDVRPHDFTIQAVKRTGTSGGSILTERFVGSPRYSVRLRQAAELPNSVVINFADTGAEQQPNNVRSKRPLDATEARGEVTIDGSTLALSADAARALADRYFRRIWNERTEASLSLTSQELKLEPGDLRTLDLDGETLLARCVKLTVKADGELATEWKYDHPSLAVMDSAAGASFDGRNPSIIIVPMPTKGFVFDIPLLTDADDRTTPLMYFAAAPYNSGSWAGASFFELVDGEYTTEVISIASDGGATWGYTSDALADANPWLWDRGSSFNTTLQTGSLTGTTEALIDANPNLNLCALGLAGRWELMQFTTATLQGDGTYTISGLKRGRRGTEWACSLHEIGDSFVMMADADDKVFGLSDVGTDMSFKAITAGRADGFNTAVSYTGATLKPYAPCDVAAVLSGGDWVITWTRRTRIGGAWVGGATIPLGETTEAYDIDVYDGADVVRTLTATTGTVTYTAAMQTADFGGAVTAGNLDIIVYQISAAVDRGFPTALAA